MTADAPQPELLPCPHCSGADIEMHPNDIATTGHQMATQDGAQVQYAHCNGCGAEGPQAFTAHEAIAAWNRRSVPGDVREVLKKCGAELRKLHDAQEGPDKDIWNIGYQKAIHDALGIIGESLSPPQGSVSS